MNWTSLDQFLHMGGYGLYVWPAYAAMLISLLAEPWLIRRRTARAHALAREQWQATQWGHDGATAWSDTRSPGDAR